MLVPDQPWTHISNTDRNQIALEPSSDGLSILAAWAPAFAIYSNVRLNVRCGTTQTHKQQPQQSQQQHKQHATTNYMYTLARPYETFVHVSVHYY